jgi:hypothetical protein
MANIKTGFSNYSFTGLSGLLGNVVDKLMDNAALFPDLPVPLATLQSLADEYAASINRATKGSDIARAARNGKAEKVKRALQATAHYVRMVAGGSRKVLTNSGFELVKDPTPVGRVGVPALRSARMTGLKGELLLVWGRVPGAKSYHCFRTETDPALPGTVWTPILFTTKVRCKLQGLTPYKPYWFSVQALGTEGPGALSNPIVGRAA